MLRPLSIVTCAVALVALSTLAQNPGSIPTKRPVKQEPSDWPMYNHDVLGTRFNPAETTLTRESVKGLKIKWVFPTKGDVYATPSVVNNIVYAGDTSGTFYALRSAGTLLWKTSGSGSIKFGPITASALVTNREREVDKMDKMAKKDRWEGVIIRSSPDKSTLTVRKVGSSVEKMVQYDSSTKWVSQEHGSKKVNDIDATQVKDGDRVICEGSWDKDGVLHATLISKRLSHPGA